MRQHVETMVAVIIGLCSFALVVPWRCLDPHDLAWTMRGDTATQVLGWLFFCDEPWGLPLGTTTRYVAPVGSTLMMTDSLPPVAVVARMVGACRLGQTQFLGLWLLVCFVLQAVTARGLAARLGMPIGQRMAACVVCAFAPIFTWRTGHVTLCGQFLILLALQSAVTANTDATKQSLVRLGSVVFFAALLHPYLMVMVVGFSVVAALRRPTHRGAAVLVVVAACAVALWLTGALNMNGAVATTGRYQTDVLDALDSSGSGRLMRPFSIADNKGEGLAYLGFGLIGGSAVWVFARGARVFPTSVLLMAGAFWLYAVSTTVLVAGRVTVRAPDLAAMLLPITTVFRATGRFVWPLWYLVAFAIVAAVGRLRHDRWALAVLVVLQLVDVAGTVVVRPSSTLASLHDGRWPALAAGRTALVLVPPILMNTPVQGREAWPVPDVVLRFALFAVEHRLSINSGTLARPPIAALHKASADVDAALQAGLPDPTSLYVFPPRDAHALTLPALCCLILDDAIACVARSTAGEMPCAQALPAL